MNEEEKKMIVAFAQAHVYNITDILAAVPSALLLLFKTKYVQHHHPHPSFFILGSPLWLHFIAVIC